MHLARSTAIRSITRLAAVCLLTSFSFGQTTGALGFNDYTIGGLGSEETSGTAFTSLSFSGGGVKEFAISAPAKDMPVILLFRACVGNSCWFPWILDSTCPLDPGVCGAFSNQSIDLDPTCAGVDVFLTTGNFGLLSVEIDLPEDIVFSTQAIVLDPSLSTCVANPMGFIFSQAFDVSTF